MAECWARRYFQRVSQPVLEYLHVPHDVELPASRQVLLAERHVTEQDTEEGSPDRLGDAIDLNDCFQHRRYDPGTRRKAYFRTIGSRSSGDAPV